MYEVRVQARFSAAHQLRMYDGRLEPLHGHDWQVEVLFRGEQLDRIGILVDFTAVEAALDKVLAVFNHTRLNDLAFFADKNPSAENVARVIYDELRAALGNDAPLVSVCVQEAPGCFAAYGIS